MKKIKLLIIPILIILLFSGCNSSSKMKDLSYSKLIEKLDNKETFFFVVEKEECPYCEKYIQEMEEVRWNSMYNLYCRRKRNFYTSKN